MEVYAITVIATLAGAMGTFLVRRGHEQDQVAAQKQQNHERRPPIRPVDPADC
jgi:hypothetical protein